MGILLFILSAISAIGVGVIIDRMVSPKGKEDTSISDLIKDKRRDASAFDKLNPEGGPIDRLDLFLAKKLGFEKRLENTHLLLGQPKSPDPLNMLHFKEICAVLFPVIFFIVFQNPLVVFAAPIGFVLPDFIYSSKISSRQDEILASFPTLVDLSALVIEAGLDYVTAFERIVNIAVHKTALEIEVDKMLGEIQFGYSRRDALLRFARRTGLQEVRSFVGLIIQSDELGTSLVDLLRNFSSDLRFRRLNRAEQLAAKASTKMLIPLFLFIFPVVFIIALGPIIADLVKGGIFRG
jgi:tight adherence protein C